MQIKNVNENCKVNIDKIGNVLHSGFSLVNPNNPFDTPWDEIYPNNRGHSVTTEPYTVVEMQNVFRWHSVA